MTRFVLLISILTFIFSGCNQHESYVSFNDDLKILKAIDDLIVLQHEQSMLAISPSFQGRVFTSSFNGYDGRSLGYFNRNLVQIGQASNNLSRLGGESRMIFGPEVGKYAIFFAPGTEQNANTIEVSPELNYRTFKVTEQSQQSVTSESAMNIRNANGYHFNIHAKRKITLKTTNEIEGDLQISLNNTIKSVAFSAESWITNKGKEQWTKENGLLSIWDLGCMLPSENNIVVIPLTKNADSITVYFTDIDETRLKVKDNIVYYSADAAYMNKIGVPPHLSQNIMGSYSPELKLLNIVTFNLERHETYVNSLWGHTNPYKGDVTNIFNGEVTLKNNWPFYEFESSSCAKELNIEESMYHYQNVYHFSGSFENLNTISQIVLGVDLAKIDVFERYK